MKSINTLVHDVNQVLTSNKKWADQALEEMNNSVSSILQKRFGEERENKPSLRMSNFGQPDRKLWYLINKPEDAEPLRAENHMKFLYGDLIEALIVPLAREAGHSVEGCQDTMEIAGLIGHRDGVIDGVLVDVKSANSRSFQKFKDRKIEQPGQDPFGYIDQLRLYLQASQADPLLKHKDKAAHLVVDKELGHILVSQYDLKPLDYTKEIHRKREMISQPEPPERCFTPVAEGASGNLKLGVQCSYCQFKKTCWPQLRTFLYASGPVYLTKVVKQPNVMEVQG